MPHSKEWEDKRLKAVRESAKNRIYKSGWNHTGESKRKMSEKIKSYISKHPEAILKAIKNLPKDVALDKNGNWRGGKTKSSLDFRIRNCGRFDKWRKSILDRDGNKCMECGSTMNLEAHHIIPLSESKGSAFMVMNGATLCRACHQKTDSWGGRSKEKPGIGKTIATIRTIPHMFQAYDTLGNYGTDEDGTDIVFISQLSKWQYETAVGLHEWFEKAWCRQHGVKVEEVDKFDDLFEKEREMGIHHEDDEPGDDYRAPYHVGHCLATAIERIVIAGLGQNWNEYADACERASKTWQKKEKRKSHK